MSDFTLLDVTDMLADLEAQFDSPVIVDSSAPTPGTGTCGTCGCETK